MCPSSGLPCECKQAGGGCKSNGGEAKCEKGKAGCGGGDGGCGNGAAGCGKGGCGKGGCAKGGCAAAAACKPTAEPIFPPELKARQPASLYMPGQAVSWYRPASLGELLALKAQFPAARMVVGNTEVRCGCAAHLLWSCLTTPPPLYCNMRPEQQGRNPEVMCACCCVLLRACFVFESVRHDARACVQYKPAAGASGQGFVNGVLGVCALL